ncbi:MAG TPA: TIM-barrel domain-containing protein [Vicinamibacterales bacterium]|nr:TIM-barrel domain-containing protein [Vicinamibacterales bacterium]
MPQAKPFPQGINWSLQPSGTFQSFDAGLLQARIYEASGHIELVGDDLAGKAGAAVIRLTPAAVETAAGTLSIGGIQASTSITNGLELKQHLGASIITTRLTFAHERVLRFEVIDWGGVMPIATAFAGPSDGHEHFYGFGEKFDGFDQAGKHVRTLTFDDPGVKGDHSYKVAPWFVSTRGYGLHLDSSAESAFDMRATSPDKYVVTNFFPGLAFDLVYGPKLTDVVSRYTGITGRPFLPPPFAFGGWISSDIWRSGGELRYAVTQFRQRGIPASAVVFDSPWETAYNDFQFNMTQFGHDATIDGQHFPGFSSIGEMMSFLQSNGLKLICWMTPFVDVVSDDEHVAGQNLGKATNYDEAAANSFFVRASPNGPPLVVRWWKGRGSPVDFTSAGARTWLINQLQTLIGQTKVPTRSGGQEPVIGGFKTDDGESGNGPNTYIPVTAQYADGRTGQEMRNGYCVEYHKTISSVLGTSGVLFARSGFAGSQAFPGYWAGDNEPNFGDNGLPAVIVAGQSAAMSGFSIWGHDTGAYQDTNFSVSPPNLFMRWAQFGCFSPIMQMHRQVTRELQYPWRYGDEALKNYLFFAKLHVRLFPYLYTYAKEASLTGLPIIRPLVLMAQDDPNTFGLEHVYLFGNELLVAPMVTPNSNARGVYLPAGTWIDFWTNARHAGGQTIQWTNPNQAQFPLFAREGAIIPMLLTEVQTLCDVEYVNHPEIVSPDDGLLLVIYPGGASSFSVHDGTQVDCQPAGAGATVTVSTGIARSISLEVLGTQSRSVTRDGAVIPQVATADQLAASETGWRADLATGFTVVKFKHPGGTSRVAITTNE